MIHDGAVNKLGFWNRFKIYVIWVRRLITFNCCWCCFCNLLLLLLAACGTLQWLFRFLNISSRKLDFIKFKKQINQFFKSWFFFNLLFGFYKCSLLIQNEWSSRSSTIFALNPFPCLLFFLLKWQQTL